MTVSPITEDLVDGVSSEQFDFQWRRLLSDRLGDLNVRSGGEGRDSWSAVQHDIGDVLVTDWHCPGDLDGLRNSAVAESEPESLLLFSVTAGRQIVNTEHQILELRPGAVLMMSSRTVCRIVLPEEMSKRTMRVPMTALSPYDMGRGSSNQLCIVDAENSLARLTHDFITDLGFRLEQMTRVEVESARNALLVLVAGMARASRSASLNESDFLPLLRRALEEWIVEHLRDGVIRVSDIAEAHHIAPRTVHRAFATTGDTMGSVVRSRRLLAARDDLVNTSLAIGLIAHRWGFCDPSHFGREFRREFEISPGDYRAAHGAFSSRRPAAARFVS